MAAYLSRFLSTSVRDAKSDEAYMSSDVTSRISAVTAIQRLISEADNGKSTLRSALHYLVSRVNTYAFRGRLELLHRHGFA